MQSKLQTIEKLFLYFLMAAIIGWCYEVFLEVVVYRWGFQNRGVLFGPYCPVYGVGMLAFLLCFGKFVKMQLSWRVRWARPILIFLGCGAVATLIELAVSYLLEWTTGSWPWQTYADYAINFQARVALSPSVRFGIGGVLFLYLLRPLFAKITGLMSEKVLHVVSITAAVIMGLDLICTVLFKLFL